MNLLRYIQKSAIWALLWLVPFLVYGLEVELVNELEVVGQFKKCEKEYLYVESGETLIKIHKTIISSIEENGEVLDFDTLSEIIPKPINFNRPKSFITLDESNLADEKVVSDLETSFQNAIPLHYDYKASAQVKITKRYFLSGTTYWPVGFFKLELGKRNFSKRSEVLLSPSYFQYPIFFGTPIPFNHTKIASFSGAYRKYTKQNYRGIYGGIGFGVTYQTSSKGPDDWPDSVKETMQSFSYSLFVDIGKTFHLNTSSFWGINLRILPTYVYTKEYGKDWDESPSFKVYGFPNIVGGFNF